MSTLPFPFRDSPVLAQEGGEDVVAEFISYVVSATTVYGRSEVLQMLRKIARPSVFPILVILQDFGPIRTYAEECEVTDIMLSVYRKDMENGLLNINAVLRDAV